MHFLYDDFIYLEKNFIQAYQALCQKAIAYKT